MGERMGPNTMGAYHAGADFMRDKLEESSDDEALLAGAPSASYDRARVAQLQAAARMWHAPPLAVRVDPAAWQRLVVDASADHWVLVHLDDDANPKCRATLAALEALPLNRRGGCELRRVEAKHCIPQEAYASLPAVFGYFRGALAARLIGRELLDEGGEAPSPELLVEKLGEAGMLAGDGDDRREGEDEDEDDLSD